MTHVTNSQDEQDKSLNRYLCWDEENRLKSVADKSYMSSYIYDAGGELVWNLSGQQNMMWDNGNPNGNIDVNLNTLYASALLTVTPNGFTKHYFIEGQRVASKLGKSMANNLVPVIDEDITNLNEEKALLLQEMLIRDWMCVGVEDVGLVNLKDNFHKSLHQFKQHTLGLENELYFYHTDHLGSSSFMTNTSAALENDKWRSGSHLPIKY